MSVGQRINISLCTAEADKNTVPYNLIFPHWYCNKIRQFLLVPGNTSLTLSEEFWQKSRNVYYSWYQPAMDLCELNADWWRYRSRMHLCRKSIQCISANTRVSSNILNLTISGTQRNRLHCYVVRYQHLSFQTGLYKPVLVWAKSYFAHSTTTRSDIMCFKQKKFGDPIILATTCHGINTVRLNPSLKFGSCLFFSYEYHKNIYIFFGNVNNGSAITQSSADNVFLWINC